MNRRQIISLEASRNATFGSHSLLPRHHRSKGTKFDMESSSGPLGFLERLLPSASKYGQLDDEVDPVAAQERWLKKYYFARVAFSVVWVAAAFTVGSSYAFVGGVLLVIYPLWDAAANLVDAQRSGGIAVNRTQAVNLAASLATTIAALVAVMINMHWVLGVYGAWAILSGLLQLATAVRRWKSAGAQWAMCLSGAQSSLAGAFFIFQATKAEEPSIKDIAGYAAFGAFYFLVSALWLTVKELRAPKKSSGLDEDDF
ncbi:hypothetical protein F5Y18DRAFT_314936 [Xylariaceae sp. FL1019]|nr:hypothetical protein F5Y18DRAFT_314936 [Xylariaceae sp. FL1019]